MGFRDLQVIKDRFQRVDRKSLVALAIFLEKRKKGMQQEDFPEGHPS